MTKQDTKEELEIIEQFINGYEPWAEAMRKISHLTEGKGCCHMCGIDPKQVEKLRDAVESLFNSPQR